MPAASVDTHFDRLSVMRTMSAYWDVDPLGDSARIYGLLARLLDPGLPGVAFAGQPDEAGAQTTWQWVSGPDAMELLDARLHQIWLPVANEVVGGRLSLNQACDILRSSELSVVIDSTRLAACLRAHGLEPADVDGDGVFLRLQGDWSPIRNSVLWAPQAAAMNYPPDDPGPPELADPRLEPAASKATVAADRLEHQLLPILRSFLGLRYKFVGASFMRMGTGRLDPPWFYTATPVPAIDDPDELAQHARALQDVAAPTLAARDILSNEVAGAMLRGSVLALRREAYVAESITSYYLLVPLGDAATSRHELSPVADRLAWQEASAAWQVYDIVTDLEVYQRRLTIWQAGVEQADAIVDELHQYLVTLRPGRKRKQAYRLFSKLRSAFLRLDATVRGGTEQIISTAARWSSALEESERLNEQLAVRQVDLLATGLDTPDRMGPFRLSREHVQESSTQAERLRERFASTSSSLAATLEDEREDLRVREERNAQVLGYGLVGVAVVSATPILVGEPDWQTLEREITGWGWPASWLGDALGASHSTLVAVSTLAAAAVVLFVLVALLVLAVQWWRRPGDPTAEHAAAIRRARRLLEEGMGIRARISPSMLRSEEEIPATTRADVERLAEIDREAAETVAGVWRDLLESAAAGGSGALAHLTPQVERFAIQQDALTVVPPTFGWTPLVLCLYFHQSRRLIGTDLVSQAEFGQALSHWSFPTELLDWLAEHTSELREADPVGCVERLIERGVVLTALLPAPVEEEGEPEPQPALTA